MSIRFKKGRCIYLAKKKLKKWYAIKSIDMNQVDLIVTTWKECEELVSHHKAVYKSFLTKEEAEDYLKNMTRNEQTKIIDQMQYNREKRKERKETTTLVKAYIPNEIYNQFQEKLKKMHYDQESTIIDLIQDWSNFTD